CERACFSCDGNFTRSIFPDFACHPVEIIYFISSLLMILTDKGLKSLVSCLVSLSKRNRILIMMMQGYRDFLSGTVEVKTDR
ncbi:MAG: hypothetical protein ACLQPD_15745, partial [Desulfomonilaceae bacterium]